MGRIVRQEQRGDRIYALLECDDGVTVRAVVRPAKGINAEPSGYKVWLVSRPYPTEEAALDAGLRAIEKLPDRPATF